jgi:hypothetical protein
MSSSLLITLEMAGVLGVVLLLGGWELWTLRRDKARDRHRENSKDAPAADNPSPEAEEHANARR